MSISIFGWTVRLCFATTFEYGEHVIWNKMSDKTLQLTADGDIHPDGFRQDAGLLAGDAATEQELKILLKTIRGEDPFDEDHGFRVFEVVTRPVSVLEREIRLALNQDDRVERVVSVTIEDEARAVENRSVDVQATVDTVNQSTIQLRTQV